MPDSEPIGLVAVTYSPGPALAGLLDSLPAATGRTVLTVLADNGSTDGSVESAAKRPNVRLLRTGANLGYGGAANRGVAALDPAITWVLVVNPDVQFGPGSIDELIAGAQRYPRAGALGPLITTPDGLVYPSARELPSIFTGAGHAVLGWVWPKNPWTRRYRRDAENPVEREAGWLSGSCLFLRRAAFDEVHGFDPNYFMYFEDVDLGDRLGRAGWSNVYCPAATVVHQGGHATERDPSAMAQAHHVSAYRYLSGRYPGWWRAPLRLALRGALAARSFVSARSNKVAGGASLPQRRAR
ncbi:glycosyl transferase family 2 [Nakamurella multipartita DSM 44233]|uniref:Glycosyl transferase family 2 n=1 Tax=Nakamurella multipartita (strain ATCC 700099 / DSM 44233 / CIP 104796 / JCM 9543 / NBRC 105858 / Y-104) TaxID=479431 RepID=C8XIK5_NAKMY|nr:glycosyl transferase family 2 [Nakamurella multipartita DSM 44233]